MLDSIRIRKPLAALAAPLVMVMGLMFALAVTPAQAATPAEQFVSDNTQKGLGILNNKDLSKDQRKAEFRTFLLSLTDIQAIGRYTLGQYRRSAAPDDLAAFDATFKEFALAVYQSYFAKYTGQTLQVTGSYPLGADETVVKSVVVDPKKNVSKPLEVNFRVQSAGGRFVVVDFSVEGVWIRELERNDFTSVLGQNGGDIKALIALLKKKTTLYH